MVYLGIDTSNYTTSVALFDGKSIIADERIVLDVSAGERGLRQSQALFQHLGNINMLLARAMKGIKGIDITAIGVSARPRAAEGSYMPVFLPGLECARTLGLALGVPVYEGDHQQGHILAGAYPAFDVEQSFMALHLSGGTTELLRVTPQGDTLCIELAGETEDLNAGQFVDRVGVALGLSFPCGAQLEALSEGSTGDFRLPSHVQGAHCSFSGAESAAQRAVAAGVPREDIAMAVQICIVRTLEKLIIGNVTCGSRLLAVGGVASNKYIREHLRMSLEKAGIHVSYALGPLSRDNAVGAAIYAERKFTNGADTGR